MRMKVYTTEGKLIRSKAFTSAQTFLDLFHEATTHLNVSVIYLSTGKGSKVLFPQGLSKRPIYYTRSDGFDCYTLPIDPAAYPIIAHNEDGSSTRVSLDKQKGVRYENL